MLGDAEFSRNLKRRLGRCSTGKSFRVVYGRIGFLENLKFQAVVKGIFEMLETKTYNLDVLAKFCQTVRRLSRFVLFSVSR